MSVIDHSSSIVKISCQSSLDEQVTTASPSSSNTIQAKRISSVSSVEGSVNESCFLEPGHERLTSCLCIVYRLALRSAMVFKHLELIFGLTHSSRTDNRGDVAASDECTNFLVGHRHSKPSALAHWRASIMASSRVVYEPTPDCQGS